MNIDHRTGLDQSRQERHQYRLENEQRDRMREVFRINAMRNSHYIGHARFAQWFDAVWGNDMDRAMHIGALTPPETASGEAVELLRGMLAYYDDEIGASEDNVGRVRAFLAPPKRPSTLCASFKLEQPADYTGATPNPISASLKVASFNGVQYDDRLEAAATEVAKRCFGQKMARTRGHDGEQFSRLADADQAYIRFITKTAVDAYLSEHASGGDKG
jgi:hypothetical protein